ncbi:MAG: hypothetical protein P8O08_00720, partial [Paracoccaceae bacterium]|nr:hypothetical protein [Paracoccaceae bacterium]
SRHCDLPIFAWHRHPPNWGQLWSNYSRNSILVQSRAADTDAAVMRLCAVRHIPWVRQLYKIHSSNIDEEATAELQFL